VPAQKYPSSSPYVTSVGGVYNGNLGSEKLQVDSISTGGFSSLGANAAQPWQAAAVRNYLTNTTGERPHGAALNASRRACPDLSVYDAGYYITQVRARARPAFRPAFRPPARPPARPG
jgi:hypothetical protein